MKPRNAAKLLAWLAILILCVGAPLLGAIAIAVIVLLAVAHWFAGCLVDNNWNSLVLLLKSMFV